MRLQTVCYRFLEPVYASDPTSGEGARIHGGRFNPKGTPALYLARSVHTAGLEAAHGFEGRVEPLTLCSYDVDVRDIVDLTTAASRSAADVKTRELNCAWRYDMSIGVDPQSWKVARKLMADGAAGILVPSYATGARRADHNLVLWRWSRRTPYKVRAVDSHGRLPRDRRSWS